MGRGACWVVWGKVESWVVFVGARGSCVDPGERLHWGSVADDFLLYY